MCHKHGLLLLLFTGVGHTSARACFCHGVFRLDFSLSCLRLVCVYPSSLPYVQRTPNLMHSISAVLHTPIHSPGSLPISGSFFISFLDATRQPLVSCLRHLQTKGGAVKLQLCDTWLREFQVWLGFQFFMCPLMPTGSFSAPRPSALIFQPLVSVVGFWHVHALPECCLMTDILSLVTAVELFVCSFPPFLSFDHLRPSIDDEHNNEGATL